MDSDKSSQVVLTLGGTGFSLHAQVGYDTDSKGMEKPYAKIDYQGVFPDEMTTDKFAGRLRHLEQAVAELEAGVDMVLRAVDSRLRDHLGLLRRGEEWRTVMPADETGSGGNHE